MQIPSSLTAHTLEQGYVICMQDLPLPVLFFLSHTHTHTHQVSSSRLTECLHQFIVSCSDGEHSNGWFQSRYVCADKYC